MAGTLRFRGETIYKFTEADRDLLVRALQGEEGEKAYHTRAGLAVSVCMINRWAMFLTLPWYRRLLLQKPEAKVYGYDSFDDMLHAYSQPVNFAWLNGGKFDENPDVIDNREKRRQDLLTRPIDSFPIQLRDLVDDILAFSRVTRKSSIKLQGGVPRDMVGLVHFYSPVYYYARKLKKPASKLTTDEVLFACRTAFGSGSDKKIYSQPDGADPRGNAFYKVPRTTGWKPDWVQVVSEP